MTNLFEQKNVIWTIYLSFTAIKVQYATIKNDALIIMYEKTEFMVKFVTATLIVVA